MTRDRGGPIYWVTTLFQCHSVDHKSQISLRLNPGLRRDSPETKHRSHVTNLNSLPHQEDVTGGALWNASGVLKGMSDRNEPLGKPVADGR
jgi:hypothetical protein